jgi:AcrR family transcriptional regulator
MSEKRDQLIRTGEALFVKFGMRRVSVEEICREAGVSKPTFYKYFNNKEALARTINTLWIEDTLQRIDEIEKEEMTFPEKMARILAVKQELSTRPGPEFLDDLITLDIDLSHALGRVMDFIKRAQEKGDIRSDIKSEFLMAAFYAINKLQHDPNVRTLYQDAEDLARDAFKLFYYGALTSHHREIDLTRDDIHAIRQE